MYTATEQDPHVVSAELVFPTLHWLVALHELELMSADGALTCKHL
jgi:hypothetical protein